MGGLPSVGGPMVVGIPETGILRDIDGTTTSGDRCSGHAVSVVGRPVHGALISG